MDFGTVLSAIASAAEKGLLLANGLLLTKVFAKEADSEKGPVEGSPAAASVMDVLQPCEPLVLDRPVRRPVSRSRNPISPASLQARAELFAAVQRRVAALERIQEKPSEVSAEPIPVQRGRSRARSASRTPGLLVDKECLRERMTASGSGLLLAVASSVQPIASPLLDLIDSAAVVSSLGSGKYLLWFAGDPAAHRLEIKRTVEELWDGQLRSGDYSRPHVAWGFAEFHGDAEETTASALEQLRGLRPGVLEVEPVRRIG